MSPLKTTLTATFAVLATTAWNARGIDTTPKDQIRHKKLGLIYEGLGIRECDLYEMGHTQTGLIERLYALGEARHPDELFRTALSDSAIIQQSNGNSWLIRVFYPPENHSPWQNTVWIAKLKSAGNLDPEEPTLFMVSEVVPVRIPKELVAFMKPYRATSAVISEREAQLKSMLDTLGHAVRNLNDTEKTLRDMAARIRKYGSCGEGDSQGTQADEDRARKLDREADACHTKLKEAIETRDRYRSMILPQLQKMKIGNAGPWINGLR